MLLTETHLSIIEEIVLDTKQTYSIQLRLFQKLISILMNLYGKLDTILSACTVLLVTSGNQFKRQTMKPTKEYLFLNSVLSPTF